MPSKLATMLPTTHPTRPKTPRTMRKTKLKTRAMMPKKLPSKERETLGTRPTPRTTETLIEALSNPLSSELWDAVHVLLPTSAGAGLRPERTLIFPACVLSLHLQGLD